MTLRVEEFRWGESATNGAALSCFQGSRITPNFKSPRTSLFNQIELVQGLPLWKYGAAHTVTEGLDMELPATGWNIGCSIPNTYMEFGRG